MNLIGLILVDMFLNSHGNVIVLWMHSVAMGLTCLHKCMCSCAYYNVCIVTAIQNHTRSSVIVNDSYNNCYV